jgi:beta-fructofuranosidase
VGDVIPFVEGGTFWLYFLHDLRSGPAEEPGTSWGLVRSTDLVAFEDCGDVLPHGSAEDPDLHAYTGSVIKADDGYHLFYTGFNSAFVDEPSGQPLQAIMHASSSDLLNWTKHPHDTFHAPGERYERGDWRDPFVFRVPGSDTWTMLIAARECHRGASRRRGCVASATSQDFHTWTVGDPFWSPALYITHECPDVLAIGEWWYLLTSEFSDRFASRYRMSRDLAGPWTAPVEDAIDGRAFYAAKTATLHGRTYAFGWLATKAGESDDGAWEWGGTLVIHELVQQPDGTLAVRLPDSIREAFDEEDPTSKGDPSPEIMSGRWVVEPRSFRADAKGTYALAVGPSLPDQALVSATIRFEPGTRACGLWIASGDDPDEGYAIRLEPDRNRLVFDRWPRRPAGPLQWQIGGDIPHAVELERWLELDPAQPHQIDVLLEDTACITYLDGRVAMSARMYDQRPRRCGWFVSEGVAEFSRVAIRTRSAAASSDAIGGEE